MSKSGIVNVSMVITEEKIIANIEKVQKLINPKNKKQIVQLEEDTYFKDLIESIKNYLVEYPNKDKFPSSVYNAAYGLVEYAINRFEENTKKVEELIKKREANIALADKLSELIELVDNKEEKWKEAIDENEKQFSEDIIEALNTLGRCKSKTSQKYKDTMKLLKAKVNNLESNLHIEIDMERLEDSSKALSFIGIEISDALKLIPAPEEKIEQVAEAEAAKAESEKIQEEKTKTESIQNIKTGRRFVKKKAKVNQIQKVEAKEPEPELEDAIDELEQTVNIEEVEEIPQEDVFDEYHKATSFDVKPSLWQRFKNSKLVRAATFIFRIKIRIELPSNALPEGRGGQDNF